MNQETALNIVIGIANRSHELTECKSTKTLKQLRQAIRVCQTLADNRAAKRSWRESCGYTKAPQAKGKIVDFHSLNSPVHPSAGSDAT